MITIEKVEFPLHEPNLNHIFSSTCVKHTDG